MLNLDLNVNNKIIVICQKRTEETAKEQDARHARKRLKIATETDQQREKH